MKNLIILILTTLSLSFNAQVSFNTGNSQLESDLNAINTKGTANFDLFKSDLSVSFGVSSSKIDKMKNDLNMIPGEIYLAFEIAKLVKKPIDDILKVYSVDKDKGWGYIAKEVGIKPGSAEFHALKNNASSHKNKGNSNGKGNNHGNSGNHGKGNGKKK